MPSYLLSRASLALRRAYPTSALESGARRSGDLLEYAPVLPMPVLVHMYIFIPLHTSYQFILVYLGHSFFVNEIKPEDTKRNGYHTKSDAHRLMRKDPIDACIIKTVECMFFQRILDADAGQPRPAAYPHTIN